MAIANHERVGKPIKFMKSGLAPVVSAARWPLELGRSVKQPSGFPDCAMAEPHRAR